MTQCRHCGGELAGQFRYCPRHFRATGIRASADSGLAHTECAAPLRRKLVEFFRGADADARKALRVSRYVPQQRVRFSVWDESGTARAAVSLDDDEAARLAAYLAPPQRLKPRLLDELRAFVRR